jgi:hypothetical protein
MEHAEDFSTLQLVDDPAVKDVFAEFCTGLNFVHGNVHMTFSSITADHSSHRASSKRVVSARIVMPIVGAIELRDMLTQIIDALTAQGVNHFGIAGGRIETAEPTSAQALHQPGFLHGGFAGRRRRLGEQRQQSFEV